MGEKVIGVKELLRACEKTPSVTLKKENGVAELFLEQEGRQGRIKFFELFGGITLAYIYVDADSWPAPDLQGESSNVKAPFLINYCVSGRCEIFLDDGSYAYLKSEELSLTGRFAQKSYVYPSGMYRGIEIFMDVGLKERWELLEAFGLNPERLSQYYCPDGSTFLSDCTSQIRGIFRQLWGFREDFSEYGEFRRRVLTVELLGTLQKGREAPQPKNCVFFTAAQVEIAKKTEQLITADLRRHYPARELAAYFKISPTSLKNYFRGVYGQNLSDYLRRRRLERAACLLVSTQKSVSEVAEMVGYANQSKFAAVFRRQFGKAPLEFRRYKALEDDQRL